MKVLVTGGTGFIGSHTVIALIEAGMKPVIVDNFDNSSPSVLEKIRAITQVAPTFYEVDCNNPEEMNRVFETEKDIQGVIHFAAYKAVGESVVQPLKYYQNNVGSLIVLLNTMKKHQTPHLVFSSSCTVYGQPEQLPVTEASPIIPAESPYGNTKQICEEVIQDLVHSTQYGVDQVQLNAVLLRYFNPIGAHPSGHIGELPTGVPNNLVPYIVQTAAGLREKLIIFGKDYSTPDGTCVRDYIHVVDLADAHVKALQFLTNAKQNDRICEVFNVGTGKGNSVQELVQVFEKVNNVQLRYEFGDRRQGDIEQIYASVDKANTQLGWQAQRSLEEGLKDAWNWQQKLMK